ncbi:MAG: hypothetical protein ABI808_02070 [Pseudonocardiales bacterium]
MTNSDLPRTSTGAGLGALVAAMLLGGCATPSPARIAASSGGSVSASAGSTAAPTPVVTSGSPSSGTPVTSSPSPPASAPRQVGLQASGTTIALRVGQTLVVTLAPNWTPPVAGPAESSAQAATPPLRRDSAVGFPSAGAAAATFTAVHVGTATVSAHTDFACLHTKPRCLRPQQLFTLTVQVLPPTR